MLLLNKDCSADLYYQARRWQIAVGNGGDEWEGVVVCVGGEEGGLDGRVRT